MIGVLLFPQLYEPDTVAQQLRQHSAKPPHIGGSKLNTTGLPQLGHVTDTVILLNYYIFTTYRFISNPYSANNASTSAKSISSRSIPYYIVSNLPTLNIYWDDTHYRTFFTKAQEQSN